MKSETIRTTFINFFTGRGHTAVPSSPVIPHGDPTILFTNAGMNQFKDTFAGKEKRPYTRAVSSQKCIRAGGKHNDLENVGKTARHLTFFEMLGNFSFGDYFKKEAIRWSWELLTEHYHLPPDRLLVTVYHDDDEARKLWHETVGVPQDRIFGLGDKDNFWSMGDTGPCGPCSEVHFDRGDAHACGPDCGIGVCDCDRFFEIWNLVFMQYNQKSDGTREPLPKPSIDTGMGLERIAMVLQEVDSVYETDLLSTIIEEIVSLSGRPYSLGKEGVPHRVIADHIRSLCFAITDGAIPSNEGQGYVVRRILRRASRYGRMLEMREPFLYKLVDVVEKQLGSQFPELAEKKGQIRERIHAEEERFGRTMENGLIRFEEIRQELEKNGGDTVSGRDIFLLHDTFGFPPDLVARMAEDEGLGADMQQYDRLMEEQKERSRADTKGADTELDENQLAQIPPTAFVGYETLTAETTVQSVLSLGDGTEAVVLESTPFYAESGGQTGDRGTISCKGASFTVTDTKKRGDHVLHIGTWEAGKKSCGRGTPVTASVDTERRLQAQRNHTATHLLHNALRSELGAHVQQRGSLVTPGRLRFDFAHDKALTADELHTIERRVNRAILTDACVETEITDKETAVKKGAIALFGEKYTQTVRMVRIEGISTELCGGTHVKRTGEIGLLKILSEGSAAAGIRRIEAVTGETALEAVHETEQLLTESARALKTQPQLLLKRIETLQKEMKELRRKQTSAPRREVKSGKETFGPITALWQVYDDCPVSELRGEWDRLKNTVQSTVAILAGRDKKKATLLVCLSPDLRGKSSIHCGNLARAGGKAMDAGGGGRPDMGQAGGKQPEKADQAIEAVLEELKRIEGAENR